MVIKKGNPEVEANIFSLLSFHWLQKVFGAGNRRTLTEDDIYPINPNFQSERLTGLLEQQWLWESQKNKNPSLVVTILKRHLFSLIVFVFTTNCEAVLRCTAPLFVAKIASYFDPKVEMTEKTAFLWSFGLLLLYVVMILIGGYANFYRFKKLGTAIRIALTGLIYRKACRITQGEIGDRSVGMIINLMTNDAQRIEELIPFAGILLNLSSVLIVSFIVMHNQIGIYATLAGFLVMFLFVPIQISMGRIVFYLRTNAAPLTDSRVKIIHEMILFIKIIKMYGWELMFKKLVEKIRLKESRYIGVFVLTNAMITGFYFIAPVVSLLVFITLKRSLDEPILITHVFFYLSMMGVIGIQINIYLGNSFSLIPQVIHSLRRIQDFLNADEIKHLPKDATITKLTNEVIANKNFLHKDPEVKDINGSNFLTAETPTTAEQSDIAVNFDNLSSRWGSETFSLAGVNLRVKKGELIAVVGPVACGKTTLLMTILQELEHEGTLNIDGRIGFSSQVPWIFNGNIEENILMNRPLDKDRLKRCIESCYLTGDLELFPNGLYTVVGERGVQLSGGQRARVNLARAVYGEDPIILLNDPLSAVDSRCAKHIFNKLIKEQLSGKTRILVTHATHFLSEVDRIVVMDTEVATDGDDNAEVVGKISHIATYSELLLKGVELSMLGVEKKVKRIRTTSKISAEFGGGIGEEISEWEEEEEIKEDERPEEFKEEKKTGSLDILLYFRYLSLSFGYLAVPILIIAMIAPQILIIFQEQYAVSWVDNRAEGVNKEAEIVSQDETHYKIYLGLACGAILLILLKSLIFVFIVYRAGRILHDKALFALLRSPMRYFDTHPIGLVINRFSKDVYFMDERLPGVTFDFAQLFILYLASVILIVIANYWFIIPLIVLTVLFLYTVRYYLTTSIEMRRIEALKRSPIMSHISATLSGLTTIRANNQIDIYESTHYYLRDEHTRCWMLFEASTEWLATRLDFITIATSVLATFLTVALRDVISASIAGLALVYVNNMIGGLQWCVNQYTETENMMTAVERIFMFAELPPEAPLEAPDRNKDQGNCHAITDSNVVQKGVIEFRNVKLKYDPDPESDYILYDLSFITKPCEKIGIVGRTGAGKSTILQALFRMVEPEGDILLDGMLTRDMGLHELRKSISIIPQESLLFSETLRVNLDPFTEFSDEYLWDALEKVELKKYISAQTGGLEMTVQEGGGNLSAGQRQLLCLARAMLKDNKFLVIDEATANVDEKTDHLIQQTLRQKFSDCTVLTIAHRINTIIDSHRVMVIDAGRLVEFDKPAVLLQRPDSIFYDLVKETGMFDVLLEQADLALTR
ncbi:ATP-binding cassette sub-family C member 4-like [Bolinopsis microptera]|uniref:ATP-binding cassette sub-family C member 4-like n=1 Tax=Bolinopsis microptera TaxID=2820187 RepID=UPI00307A70CC